METDIATANLCAQNIRKLIRELNDEVERATKMGLKVIFTQNETSYIGRRAATPRLDAEISMLLENHE